MQVTEKITPKHGFKSIFLECAFVYGKSVQPLNDCTQTKIRRTKIKQKKHLTAIRRSTKLFKEIIT